MILFILSGVLAVGVFLIFYPNIEKINEESPILINIMFVPALLIGFFYGMRITERAVSPEEVRSPMKRRIMKIFLFFFVIGGLFSSVNFALNGGSIMPTMTITDDGLLSWALDFIRANGGVTFLIVTSITLMASATKRIIGIKAGMLSNLITVVTTFIFFSMLILSFTKSDPTNSGVFLYTFYHAGIVGGAFFVMNRFTKNLNMWEDFRNGY